VFEGEIHHTLLNTWNQIAAYYGLENQNNFGSEANVGEEGPTNYVKRTMTQKEQRKNLDSKLYSLWKAQWEEFGVKGCEDESLGKEVVKVKSVEIFNRKYVPSKDVNCRSPANSNVEVFYCGDRIFGRINLLFVGKSAGDVWFVVRPFTRLNRWDQPKNPYKDLMQLNTRLLYSKKFEPAIVVHQSRVVGHIAILENEEGTFGINRETISAVSLGSVVCFFFFFSLCEL
jgi:hypothetical protein